TSFSGYTISPVPLIPGSGYTVVGPRGVAFNAAGTLLFTNGRLDNSLTAINTSNPSAFSRVQMQDPTPSEIRAGRQFLYSTRFSRRVNATSGETNGFVSCASCHVDGRTDGLLWDLSAPTNATPIPVAPNANDAPPGSDKFPFAFQPVQKGPMMTQTL